MAGDKENVGTFRALTDLTKGHRKYAVVLFVVMVLAAMSETLGLSLILPLLSNLIGDTGQWSGVLKYMKAVVSVFPASYETIALLGLFFTAYFAKSTLQVVLAGMTAKFAMRLRRDWSMQILSRYVDAEYGSIMGLKHGEMVQNAVTEPMTFSQAMIVFLNFMAKLIVAAAIFAMLFLVNWRVTLGVAVCGGVIYYLTRHIVQRYAIAFGKQRLATDQRITAEAGEALSSVKELKIFGNQEYYRERLDGLLARYTTIVSRFAFFNKMPESLLELAVLFIVAGMITYVALTPGGDMRELISVMGFFVIAGQKFFNYVSFVISRRMKFASDLPSMRLIHSVIFAKASREELDSGEEFAGLAGDIEFKEVGFGYGPDQPVLQGFSMRMRKNEMTALIGPSGAGKSTVADLLMRLYEPDSGAILADGHDVADFSLSSWRGKIGYVGQDAHLFNASARENILVGKPGASDEEVERAARLANIHEFLSGLPEGYETVVGDRGVKLSGGQRQRIVIARALIRDPDILIFDEATSALDRDTELEIQKSIEGLAGEKTVLVIAHRLSTIEKASMVYDLGKEAAAAP